MTSILKIKQKNPEYLLEILRIMKFLVFSV